MSDEFDPIILPKDDSGGGADQDPQQLSRKEKRGCLILAVCAVLAVILGWKILDTPWLCAMAFGAVFLLIGVLAAKQAHRAEKPEYRYAVTCLAIGGFAAAAGILLLLERFGIRLMPEDRLFEDRFRSGIFILIGAGILAFLLAGFLHKRRWCTERVEATCVELVQVRSRRGRVSQVPVYEFFCGGATHLLRGNTASTSANPHVGETRMIYVDPVHLDEMYDPKPYYRMLIFPCLFGALFIALGIWLMTLPPLE